MEMHEADTKYSKYYKYILKYKSYINIYLIVQISC